MKSGLIIDNKYPVNFRGIYNGVKYEDLTDGDWSEYLPTKEPQIGIYFDTLGCVTFSALNVIETIFNYYIDNNLLEDCSWFNNNGYLDKNGWFNFSDRYIAELSGTHQRGGNSGSNVAETIMKYGLIPEKDYSFPDRQRTPPFTAKEYYKDIPKHLHEKAKEFKKRFDIKYERVYKTDWDEALKASPLQVYVRAWYKNDDGVYYNDKKSFNHAVMKFSQEDKIFDHYTPYIKEMTPDYVYYDNAFRYSITKKNINMDLTNYENYLIQLVEGKGGFGLIANGKLYTDDVGKILASWAVRNDGNTIGKTIEFTLAQWNGVDRYNLKNKLIHKI